jgi:hypothetical protein
MEFQGILPGTALTCHLLALLGTDDQPGDAMALRFDAGVSLARFGDEVIHALTAC